MADLRSSQLVPETLSQPDAELRSSQLVVETLTPNDEDPAPSYVTQAGALSAQQDDVAYVTQAGMGALQQSDEIYVTQIGLLIIYGEAPPTPPCPGLVDGIRQDGLAAGTPAANCLGGDGTLGLPRIGASHETTVVAGPRDAAGDLLDQRAA